MEALTEDGTALDLDLRARKQSAKILLNQIHIDGDLRAARDQWSSSSALLDVTH